MFERFVERRAAEAVSDTPVVLIVGPRRAGKTTLVRKMGEAGRTYITLDDQTALEAAQSDPAGPRFMMAMLIRAGLPSRRAAMAAIATPGASPRDLGISAGKNCSTCRVAR